MLTGEVPTPEHARAIEQYMILTIDHGFNASTFTARVVTSTGADLGAAIVAAIGALSGPLHGGAPSRALDMLDAIGTPDRADAYIRHAVENGERIMGFGHRVYKTEDPRSLLLRGVTERLGGPLVEFSESVERTVVEVLAELKPGRQLYANVEFYAGVVMHTCGIPREMFTPTFAAGRTIGWCTHVMEQAAHNRLIRPAARYVGPPPPQPVPAGRLRPARGPCAAGTRPSEGIPTKLVRYWILTRGGGAGHGYAETVRRPSRVRSLFSFPNPVNEVSARLVAAGVVLMSVLTIAFDLKWMTVVIAYGFVARVLTGPTLSPLGQLVTRVVTPRLGRRAAPGGRATQALRPGHGGGLLADRVGPDRPRVLDRGAGRARPAGGGGHPRVGVRHLPRLHDLRRAHARRRRARRGVRALQRHLGHATRRGRLSAQLSCRRSRTPRMFFPSRMSW